MTTLLKTTALLAASALSASAANVLVTPTGLTNDSGVTEFFPAIHMINNTGLIGGPADINNYNSVTHGAAGSGSAWTTVDPGAGGGDYYADGGTAAIFTMTLDAVYQLSDLVLWGYHFGSANGNEAREFTLGFSTDGGATFPTSTVASFPLSTFAVGSAATLSLGGTFSANAVQVNFTDNHFGGTAPGGDRIGVGELKFIAIPEPSTAVLALLGTLGFALRRQK